MQVLRPATKSYEGEASYWEGYLGYKILDATEVALDECYRLSKASLPPGFHPAIAVTNDRVGIVDYYTEQEEEYYIVPFSPPFLLVGYYGDDFSDKCYCEVDGDGNMVNYGRGAVVIEFSTDRGRIVIEGLPILIPIVAAIAGGVVTYKVFDWLKEREHREAIEAQEETIKTLAQLATDNPDLAKTIAGITYTVVPTTVAEATGEGASLWDRVTSFAKIAAMIAGLTGLLFLLVKLNIIRTLIEEIREAFRR